MNQDTQKTILFTVGIIGAAFAALAFFDSRYASQKEFLESRAPMTFAYLDSASKSYQGDAKQDDRVVFDFAPLKVAHAWIEPVDNIQSALSADIDDCTPDSNLVTVRVTSRVPTPPVDGKPAAGKFRFRVWAVGK